LLGLLGGVALTGAAGLAAQAPAQEPGPSLWNEEQGSRYSNRKARHVGDLITVLVTESSMGSNRSSLKTKKQSKFNAAGGPGSGPLGFLPSFGAKTDIKDEMDGGGQTVIQGELNTKITAQVLEIRGGGKPAHHGEFGRGSDHPSRGGPARGHRRGQHRAVDLSR
jgi:flagellar basal body L-ring protein FlgH